MKTRNLLLIAFTFLIVSCENKNSSETENAKGRDSIKADSAKVNNEPVLDTAGMMVKADLRLIPLKGSSEFQDATLEVNAPKEKEKLKAGPVEFKFEVKNYHLKSQTPNSNCPHCNNSKDGQHIHLILNNEPYIAIYDTTHKVDLKDGQYVALSFLSRSFHESIKQFQAFDLRQFTVGTTKTKPYDLTKPMLFYSRPKGEYVGEFAKNILLDFYLTNTDLASDGNKVKATINGNEFVIEKWQPFIIQGLPMGESTIKLELIDKNGKAVPGPYNTIERKITLKEQAAM